MDTEDKKEIDELVRNYEEMDETGKEKLKEVSEKFLDIWNTVNNKEQGTPDQYRYLGESTHEERCSSMQNKAFW